MTENLLKYALTLFMTMKIMIITISRIAMAITGIHPTIRARELMEELSVVNSVGVGEGT